MTIGPVVFGCIGLVVLLALGFAVLQGFRRYERAACNALGRRFADLDVHDPPQPGDVLLVYHTYHGVLAWFTQTEHRAHLPPKQARELLGRLLRFNCTWGLIARGGVLVLPLAIVNYFIQRRAILTQETELEWTKGT
jgi:hypothetical protein